MNLSNFIKPAQKFLADNTPTLLSGAGVVGVAATVALTGKATIKAYQIIDQAEFEKRCEILQTQDGAPGLTEEESHYTTLERIKLVWPEYVPVAGALAVTVFCIIAANRVSAKEAAALAAAYGLSQDKFADYRAKVQESFGVNKEKKVREDVIQDKVTKDPPPATLIISGNGKVLCRDAFSDRYFESDVESIRKAVNDFNEQLRVEMDMSLTDFYNFLDIPATGYSHEIGWSSGEQLDVDIVAALTNDNRPVVVMDFAVPPKHRDLYR